MFGKKKEPGVVVMHYEGIDQFATDYPIRLDVKGDVLEIKRVKPETIVTLPTNRIQSITIMEEKNFMLKYHGQAVSTSKTKGIKKTYLVIQYDKGMLAFWGTSHVYKHLYNLQKRLTPGAKNIEL